VFSERTSVGLDVHARSVVACAINTVTGELIRCRLTPQHADVLGWISCLPGPAAVAYEAGPTGFGLARALSAAGIRCEVLAPSRLQRPAAERGKTDARDAWHLAKLLRLDEFTAVRVPPPAEEAARDRTRSASGRDPSRPCMVAVAATLPHHLQQTSELRHLQPSELLHPHPVSP